MVGEEAGVRRRVAAAPRCFQWSLGLTLGVVLSAVVVACPDVLRGQAASRPVPGSPAMFDLEATERALYDASRKAPRHAPTRAALGEWLASRGQVKSGAVLLEEARLFGGDARTIGLRLAAYYAWLRDWPSLVALPLSPLSAAERARAQALVDRAGGVTGEDSTVVAFAPLEVGALGRLPLVLGLDTLWGEVDPQETGIVLPGLGRGAGLVEVTGEDQRGMLGILREGALGALTLRQVPVRLDAALGVGRARLGFDVFAQLAPTVDARAGTVTLRRTGRTAARAGAVVLPMLLGFPGVRLVPRPGDAPVVITSPAGRAALRGRVWTVDVRRGVIWAETAR